MPEPVDVLDQKDPLAAAFMGALLVHGGVIALLFFGWFWMNQKPDTLGVPKPGGGPAYTVAPVHSIPIPQQQAPVNPVANDTQSLVRSAPAKQEAERQTAPDKNAFELPDKRRRVSERPVRPQDYEPPAPVNQVYSSTRQAVSNPMYGGPTGGGQVGIGPNSPLGNRLGWYAEIVRQRISQNWQTSGLLASGQRYPAIVSFYIRRNGTVSDIQVVQSSGNPNVDDSAKRAVYLSSPLPALPAQVTENVISAQFTFNLR